MEASNTPASHPAGNKNKLKLSKKRLTAIVVGVVVALLVIGLSGWFLNRSSTAATIDGNKYQAVFFTNGQVYFGKLNQVNAGYFKLTDVFYIQASDAEQGPESDSENPQQTSAQSTDIRLIKLGSEVHGPDDEMIISKDQILFFENLKKDGKVTDSIIKYNQQKQ